MSLADLGRFVRGPLINGRSEREAAREQLRAINTKPDDPDRLARELSGGNQQKVVLARWLMHECRVLLLDEPTRGVDVGAKQEIYRLIAELAKTGIAVVMVSSETEELLGLSTRILVMREGTVVAELDGAARDRGRAALARRRAHRHITTAGGGNVSTAPAAGRRFPALPFGGGRIELQEYALVGVVVLLLVVGAILEPDAFLTKDNMLNVLRQASIVGVVAIGMTFVIATGGIDLSVGSMVAAAGVAGGQFADSGSLMFILGALAMGVLLGGVNAAAIAYGRVVPFIATLAMFTMARGLALWISDKTPISVFEPRDRPLVRHGGDHRDPLGDLRLPRRHGVRLDPAQPHALRALRGRGRRQPGGGADRRRQGPADRLQRVRAQRHLRGDRGDPAVRAPLQRVARRGQPARARCDRRGRDRRDRAGRRPRDDRRHVPRAS